jgi:hypothetical protein
MRESSMVIDPLLIPGILPVANNKLLVATGMVGSGAQNNGATK